MATTNPVRVVYRVVTVQQAKAAKELFDTLSTTESDFYDKKLGPVQINNKPGTTGVKSIYDFTCVRHSLDQFCHAGQMYHTALAGVKEISQRYRFCVVDPRRQTM
jgi:hypothetical protein